MKVAFLLFALCAHIATASYMRIYGNMTCSYPIFRYTLKVMEDDILFDDKLLMVPKEPGFFLVSSPHEYSFRFMDTADGNSAFEIQFLIYHNCTDYGGIRFFRQKVATFPNVPDGKYEEHYDFCLTNRGVQKPKIEW